MSLAADVVEAEAGATTPVSLTVVNRGTATDRYEVEVEGIDPEWRFVPVPTFAVEPGESRSEKVFLKPPRMPESVAGSYPFVIRVRSLETGDSRNAQALLKLPPFHHVTMEISPKKGVVSPTTHRNDFRLSLVNLGNSEHTLQLSAQDPDDRCAYEFDQDQVTLGPGQGKEVEMVADPKQKPLLSSGRLIGFSVFARSLNERTVTATAQAQLEQRSLLSPATLVGAALLAAVVGGWWTMRPKPTEIHLFTNPAHALAGTSIQLTYQARNASNVVITMGDGEGGEDTVYKGPPTGDPITVTLKGKDFATFTATADQGGKETSTDIQRVAIDVAPPVAEAVIKKFYPDSKRVKLGTSFVAKWEVENATKVVIEPLPGEVTDHTQLEITPTTVGEQTYALVATNSAGKTTRKTLTVDVYDESDAQILAFAADPPTAKEESGGKVTLSWQTSGAERVELTVGTNAAIPVDPNVAGTRDIVVTTKTPCILTAYDAKGRKRSKTIGIQYEKAPITVEPSTAGATTAGGTPPPDPNFPDKIPPP